MKGSQTGLKEVEQPKDTHFVGQKHRYKKSKAIKELERSYYARKLTHDTNAKKIYFNDRTARNLEKSIIAYVCLKGWQCEKIQSMGRTIYKDGKPIFVRNNWQTGTADLSAIVAGKAI